jgi:ferredoxin-fold anticodon binding domain-containing protein
VNKLRYRDQETGLEVIARWERRRWRVQQREKAMTDLKAAFADALDPLLMRLARLLERGR